MATDRDDIPSGNMPDTFERLLGQMEGGLPGLTRTKPTTIQTVPVLGVGGSTMIVLQTFRQEGQLHDDQVGDSKRAPARFTTFVRVVQGERAAKFVLTDQVLKSLLRQVASLSDQATSAAARRAAQTRKDRGFVPTFGGKRGRAKARKAK